MDANADFEWGDAAALARVRILHGVHTRAKWQRVLALVPRRRTGQTGDFAG
jgi:hypothetical protein